MSFFGIALEYANYEHLMKKWKGEGDQNILDELKIDLNLRPQNLDFNTYYHLTSLYENLRR